MYAYGINMEKKLDRLKEYNNSINLNKSDRNCLKLLIFFFKKNEKKKNDYIKNNHFKK